MPTASYVPMVGRIAAGGPILAEERIEDVFPLPKQLVGDGQLFLLEVSGDSMVDAAICNGDYVVIRQQPTAENGEIVAAMIDGEATVKTFQKKARPGLAAAPQRGVRADRRHPRHDPRQGHGGPAPDVTGAGRRPDGRRPATELRGFEARCARTSTSERVTPAPVAR